MDASRLLLYDVGTGNDFLSTVGIERVRSRKVRMAREASLVYVLSYNGYTRPVGHAVEIQKGIEYGSCRV